MSLKALREMSNRYGSDPRYVLAGGGNTSYKEDDILYVKGSGAALATVREEQFVSLDRTKLAAVWRKTYPEDFDAREAEALRDLMDARMPGENGRPSVETLLHDILPFRYVCHLHPGLVNAVTCAADGKSAAARLFPDALWVDAIMPGYILAASMKEKLDAAGTKVPIFFIENHGVFVGGDTVGEIDEHYNRILSILEQEINVPPSDGESCEEKAAEIAPILRMLLWEGNSSYLRFASCVFQTQEELQSGLILTLTPDHMVYCGREPLFIDPRDTEIHSLRDKIEKYRARNGVLPRVVAIGGIGLFASGGTIASCDAAHDLMLDSASICRAAAAFGGAKPMPDELIGAIAGWEVERYRKNVVMAGAAARAAGKIAIVTGAAQGFGKGIAEELSAAGAMVTLGDMNIDGAREAAREIGKTAGGAFAVECDVSDEESVRDMVRACVLRYGGLDLMISNAGIVRAGGLEDISLETFELCAKVNYSAFFLCAKYAARVMKAQNAVQAAYMSDIIQINSKSGLSGSNKNFAYAGAKFGGIGLVQSFALELAEHGIKVNAVCPGNFLDGPLWSDPEKGLFAQYLRAGKVPGAKTVDDVRAFYEAKVPLGRGCRVTDVTRAILYILEQEYETGQALPVTGGQEMLK